MTALLQNQRHAELREKEQPVSAAYPFVHPCFDHQSQEWNEHRADASRAVFWEQGTGKTKLVVDNAGWLYSTGCIDGLLILAPDGVHRNWTVDEIPEHLPKELLEKTKLFAYTTSKSGSKRHQRELEATINHRGFAVLAMSYDAFMTPRGKQAAWDFLCKRKAKYVLDEPSGAVKNPKTDRTKSVVKSGQYAWFRRILDGTPITNSPFDIYAPVQFLDGEFWKRHGFNSFLAFKNHFGVWRKRLNSFTGREFHQLVGYRRLDELQEIIKPISTRVLKKDVLDLPEKLYTKWYVELNSEQERVYKDLVNQYYASLPQRVPCVACGASGQQVDPETGNLFPCEICYGTGEMYDSVTAELTITRLLRLQQVVCGYVPTDYGDEPVALLGDVNPRLQAAVEFVDSCKHKGIIWARFQMDVDLLADRLRKEGFRVATYDGRTSDDHRDQAKWRFQGRKPVMERGKRVAWEEIPESEQIDWFIGNPAAAATGLTLTAAESVLYYSNTFKLRERLQSEDRAHRIGQRKNVNYCDIITPGTIDEKLVRALRNKLDVASKILGDDIKEWI